MKKVLVFAPHNDDEVLGVGGTIKRYSNNGDEVYVCEVTTGPHGHINQSEAKEAHKILGVKETFFLNLPVNELRIMDQVALNAPIFEIVKRIETSVVFVPHIGDMHTDHGAVTSAVMVAVRPTSCNSVEKIFEYETLSETGWNIPNSVNSFIPNVWVDISNTIEDKINAMNCYENQLQIFPYPRSEKAIRALSEYRGSTICVNNAEAFVLVREILR